MQPKHNLLQSKNVSFASSSCSCKSSSRHLVGSCQSASSRPPKVGPKKPTLGNHWEAEQGHRPSNQRYFVKTCPMPISPIDDLRYFFLPSSDLFPVVFLSHSECFTLVATYYMNERVSCFHLRQMFSSTSSTTSSPAVCVCCGHPPDLLLVRLVIVRDA